jgi:hypothetical protein
MTTPSSYDKFDKHFAEGEINEYLRVRALISQHHGTNPLPTFYRYVVIDTIFDPQAIDEAKLEYWKQELGVSNIEFAAVPPRNAIIARRVRRDTSDPVEITLLLYPFFPPNLSLPCKPGEHVWVMFEDRSGQVPNLGYWMCRIVQPGFVEDANHTHPPRRDDQSFAPGLQEVFEGTDEPVYEFRNGVAALDEGERYTDAESSPLGGDEDLYKTIMLDSDGGRLTTYEPVPRYRKRPADVVLEGTNNTLIVMGTDRVGPVAEYGPDPDVDPDNLRELLPNIPISDAQLPGAGSIDLVAGRGQTPATGGTPVDNDLPAQEIGKSPTELSPAEGDPDLATDRSRVLIAQRTRVDTNLGTQVFNEFEEAGVFQGSAQDEVGLADDPVAAPEGDGAIVIKSDKVRIIARSDIEFLVTGYTRGDDGTMVTDDDTSHWAAVILKANGDIIMRPAAQGYIKLGGDEADKAIICTDFPAIAADGSVDALPINTTMAGQLGGTGIKTQGAYATKILVVGPTRS